MQNQNYNQGQPMQQQDDKTFVNGMRIERKFFQNGGSIDKVGINVNDFIQFLQQHASPTGWVNFDIKTSQKTGQPYAELNTWKPQQQAPQAVTQQYIQQNPQQFNNTQNMGNQPQYQQPPAVAPQMQQVQQPQFQQPAQPQQNQQGYKDETIPF